MENYGVNVEIVEDGPGYRIAWREDAKNRTLAMAPYQHETQFPGCGPALQAFCRRHGVMLAQENIAMYEARRAGRTAPKVFWKD